MMQTHPDQSERALELLYAAMRARDAAPPGSPAWRSADEQAQAIREAYLRSGQTTVAGPQGAVHVEEVDDDAERQTPTDYWFVR